MECLDVSSLQNQCSKTQKVTCSFRTNRNHEDQTRQFRAANLRVRHVKWRFQGEAVRRARSLWTGTRFTSKSAHTALAVKACLLGGNSYTKCSITFVNIAVAISALAGGPKNGFAPRPEYGGVFDIFRGFLGVWAQEGIEMEFWVILVAFRQWKNGQKWKKHCT